VVRLMTVPVTAAWREAERRSERKA